MTVPNSEIAHPDVSASADEVSGNQSSTTVPNPESLDNTLTKLLTLQSRMLKVSNDISAVESVSQDVKREQFNQNAELSSIIASIGADKARQASHTDVLTSVGEVCGHVPASKEHVATPPQPGTAFPFLSLPTEIRLMVYEALPITTRSITLDINMEYFFRIYTKEAPVSLFATSREVCNEAELIMQRIQEELKPDYPLLKPDYPSRRPKSFKYGSLPQVEGLIMWLIDWALKCGLDTIEPDLYEPIPFRVFRLAPADMRILVAFLRRAGSYIRPHLRYDSPRIWTPEEMDYLRGRGIVPEHSTKPPVRFNAMNQADHFSLNPGIAKTFKYDRDETAGGETFALEWFDKTSHERHDEEVKEMKVQLCFGTIRGTLKVRMR